MPLNGIYWSQINYNDIVGLFHRINAAYNIDCILITNKIILLIFLIWLAAIFPENKVNGQIKIFSKIEGAITDC